MRELAQLFPADIQAVIHLLPPYKGGDDQLFYLNKIANSNKHQLLRPMAIDSEIKEIHLGRVSAGAVGIRAPVWDSK